MILIIKPCSILQAQRMKPYTAGLSFLVCIKVIFIDVTFTFCITGAENETVHCRVVFPCVYKSYIYRRHFHFLYYRRREWNRTLQGCLSLFVSQWSPLYIADIYDVTFTFCITGADNETVHCRVVFPCLSHSDLHCTLPIFIRRRRGDTVCNYVHQQIR